MKKKRSLLDENVDNCAEEERAEDVEGGFFIKEDDGLKGRKEKRVPTLRSAIR